MAIPNPIPQQSLPKFKFYRVLIYKNFAGQGVGLAITTGYAAISEFGMFNDGANISTGGIATASTTNGGYVAAQGIDGNEGTTWESTSSDFPHWFKVELPTPKGATSFTLVHRQWGGELPTDFDIQGSNDDAQWTTITSVKNWSQSSSTIIVDLVIAGKSVTSTGAPAVRVDFYNWQTKVMVGSAYPDTQGNWRFASIDGADSTYMVVHHGPPGFKPQVDGPVTPYKLFT